MILPILFHSHLLEHLYLFPFFHNFHLHFIFCSTFWRNFFHFLIFISAMIAFVCFLLIASLAILSIDNNVFISNIFCMFISLFLLLSKLLFFINIIHYWLIKNTSRSVWSDLLLLMLTPLVSHSVGIALYIFQFVAFQTPTAPQPSLSPNLCYSQREIS